MKTMPAALYEALVRLAAAANHRHPAKVLNEVALVPSWTRPWWVGR